MAYTQDEIDAAVQKLVRASVRFNYNNLGTRSTGTTFDDVQDSAAGVLIGDFRAAYYVVLVGARSVLQLVADEASFVNDFVQAVRSTGRNVTPVTKLSFLQNARVALDALAVATGQRSGAFLDLDKVPAFQRFDQNTQRFLDAVGPTVREGGDVVPTPQEARATLAGLARDLRELHAETLRRVGLLAASIGDYETLDLPSRLSRDIVQNAASVLGDHYDALEALSPTDRLSSVRSVVLDVLAARAAVSGFGSLSPQTLFVVLAGTGAPVATAALPATPAALESDLQGPYAVFPGQDRLTVLVDGADTLELQLPGSFVPFLQVPSRGPYTVDVAANEFTVSLTGYPDVDVVVPAGTVDPWDVVDAVNAAVTTQPLEARLDFIPVKTTQAVNLVHTGSTHDLDFDLDTSAGTWAALGVGVGDRLLVSDSSSSMNGFLFEVASTPAGPAGYDRVSTTLVHGGALSDETDKVVQAGTDAAVIWRVGVVSTSSQAALDGRWVMTLSDVEDGSLSSMGLYPGSSVTARKTSAKDAAAYLSTSGSASLDGVARVGASATFVESRATLGRTNPQSVRLLSLYSFRGTGDVASGGTTAVFSLPDLAGELALGDQLVLRETSVLGEVGLVGNVTVVSGTTVTADFSPASVTAVAGVLVEGGPSLAGLEDATLRVATGGYHDGDYTVTAVSGLDATVDPVVPVPADAGGQPFLLDAVSVGRFRLDLQTLSTGADSALEVQAGASDASSQFFSAVPKSAVGTTVYFQLPLSKNIDPGDQLELYDTAVASPDVAVVVKQVLGGGVVELETAVDVTHPAVAFTNDSPVPFGRVRKKVRNDFDTFKAAAATWLALGQNNLLTYFRQLDATLNPLVSGDGPTLAQVDAAATHLLSLLGVLTKAGAASAGADPNANLEAVLGLYHADAVDAVDTLLSAYADKGADRARAVLLEGRFSDFFGMNADEASYAGYVQKTIQDVARNDLPVRKTGRQDRESVAANTQLASWDDTDFEYTNEDLDPSENLDDAGQGDVLLNIPTP